MGPLVRRTAPSTSARDRRAHPTAVRRGLRAADRGVVLRTVEFSTAADLAHSPETVFRYLAEPRNRPEWQASLLSVTLHERGEPRVGTTWRDNTMAGVRPTLRITRLEPYRVWAEVGRWRGIEAELTMRFTAIAGGCRVTATGRLSGSGPWGLAAAVAGRFAGRAVRHDLLRAGEVLTRGRRRPR